MISTSTKNQMQRGVAVEVTTVKKEDVLCIKIKSDTFHRLGLLKANRDFSINVETPWKIISQAKSSGNS